MVVTTKALIFEFLDCRENRERKDTLKLLKTEFNLDIKVAEEIYKAWKKEYMKSRVG